MTPLESSVSDAPFLSITLESSIMITEASFKLIYHFYSTGVTYDDRNVFIVLATSYILKGYNANPIKLFTRVTEGVVAANLVLNYDRSAASFCHQVATGALFLTLMC
jgi:hypothetical protein